MSRVSAPTSSVGAAASHRHTPSHALIAQTCGPMMAAITASARMKWITLNMALLLWRAVAAAQPAGGQIDRHRGAVVRLADDAEAPAVQLDQLLGEREA